MTLHKNLVSVVIPTYNRSSLLKEAIQSVIDQSYRPIECIVVDDGSTDDTQVVVDGFKDSTIEDFEIIYIKQINSGGQVARNKGTSVSKGEFLQYLDSDDILYPDKLKFQVEYLLINPECDGVFGDWDVGTYDIHFQRKGYASEDLIKQIVTLNGCIHTFSILYRRKIIETIGKWDVEIKKCQELDFQLRGLIAGANFHYQSLNTGLWREHDGPRIMSKLNVVDLLNFYQKWEKILTPIGKFDSETKFIISNWYVHFASSLKNNVKSVELLICEAVRLNPSLPLYNSYKIKFIRFFFGKKVAIKIWSFWYAKILS